MPNSFGKIAVVGHACRFPGGADTPEAFWTLLTQGRDAVTEVPPDRFDAARFLHPDRAQRGKSYSFAAGVIGDVAGFDAGFFNISPREAREIDPQQRLLLELTWEAFERAGMVPGALAGSDCAVYVGISGSDYAERRMGDLETMGAYFMLGSTLSIAANRISYAFDLRGPSMAIDTACSSSLVALNEAVQTLQAGRAPMAVVGGVNLLLSPAPFIGFAKAQMLSQDGRCRPFSSRPGGYVRAEGGGVLILKPLDDAMRDGDPIVAVIRASGANTDGRTHGIALPSSESQEKLLRSVYRRARIDPRDVSYLEAHGTGTVVGDPAEARAIGRAIGQRRPRSRPLPIGSVKGNIGHLEPASGIAGVIKAIEMLRHGQVPPSLHLDEPNPDIPFDALNLAPAAAAHPLERHDGRAVIGVNSFGFGGANAHVVLESFTAPHMPPAPDGDYPLAVSGKTPAALRQAVMDMRAALDGTQSWSDLARSAALHRTHHEHRLMLRASSADAAKAALDAWNGESRAVAALGARPALIFVGNGAQWAGMGRQALHEDPVFAQTIARVDASARWRLGWSIAQALESGEADIADTRIAQPLLFAIQIAIAESLKARGIVPGAVAGHSVGEISAACIGGALSLEQACTVIRERSEAQHQSKGMGRMMAAGLAEDAATPWLTDGVEIAAVNSPHSVTLTGPEAALENLHAALKARGIAARMLELDYPFHSAAQDGAKDHLLAALAAIAPSDGTLPFYSTVTGTRLDGAALDAGYWWRNMRRTVRMADAIAAMAADGHRLFLEIGPQPLLQANIRQSAAGAQALASLSRTDAGAEALDRAVTRAFMAGTALDFTRIFPAQGNCAALPTYPWQRERHWYEPTPEAGTSLTGRQDAPLLGLRAAPGVTIWENQFDAERLPLLADHKVGGSVVVPAAAYAEMALEAGAILYGDQAALLVENLEIRRPLVLDAARMVRFTLDDNIFRIESRERMAAVNWVQHATGRLSQASSLADAPALAVRGETISAAAHYDAAEALGFSYGPAFQTLAQAVRDGKGRGAATLTVPPDAAAWRLHPALLDGVLQTVLATVQDMAGVDGAGLYVPQKFARLTVRPCAVSGPLRAEVTLLKGDAQSLVADCRLRDGEDKVIAELKGARFVPLPLRAPSIAAPARYQTVMTPLPALPENSAPPAPLQAARNAMGRAAGFGDSAVLDDIAAAFAAEALLALGEDAAIAPARLGLMAQVIAAAEHHTGWEMDAAASWRQAMARHPALSAELNLLGRSGQALAASLQGADLPAASEATLAHLFDGAPLAAAANTALAQAVHAFAQAWPADRPLRVLEVGAGHGGFTHRLIAALRGAPAMLTLADKDAAQAAALAARFELDTLAFDIMDDAALPDARFDLIVGAQVLRALPDAATALSHLQRLAAPGAALLFAELTPSPFTRIAFPADNVDALPLDEDKRMGFSLLHMQASDAVETAAACPRAWLLAMDDAAMAADLAREMTALGQDCEILALPPDENWNGPWRARFDAIGPGRIRSRGLIFGGRDGALVSALKALNVIDPDLQPASLVLLARDGTLAGLGRVLRNERPSLDCPVIRGGDAAALAREIVGGGEREVLLDGAARAAPRLLPAPDQAVPRAPDEMDRLRAPGGSLELLAWERRKRSLPARDEVEIEVRAAGLNFRDVMFAMGALPAEILESGYAGAGLGMEAAGIVTRVGEDVTGLKPGDRVACFAPSALASHVVTRRFAVSPLPNGISFAEGATMIVPFFTVVYGLKHLARLTAGERILIHGAAGGVGIAAIQYARHCGAEIFATAGSTEKRDWLRLMGVAPDHILDSRGGDFAAAIRALTNDEGVDVVLNALAGEAVHQGIGLLKPFGRFVELGKVDFVAGTRIGLAPFRNNITYHGVDADQLMAAKPALAADIFADTAALFAAGAFAPLPYRSFPQARMVEAFRLMQRSRHIGKIVIEMTPDDAAQAPRAIAIDPQAQYLVTGGLNGLGLASARWLAAKGARRLALASRNPVPDADARSLLDAMQEAGVEVSLHGCDMRDGAAVAALVTGLPQLKGVIHAAAAYDDALLADMTQERWDAAMGAKADGARHLDAATRGRALDFLLLYSSISAVIGNIGQANYAAANLVLEDVAAARRASGLPVTVAALGPVAETGQLARQGALAASFEQMGMKPLKPAAVFAELDKILFAGQPGDVVADVNWHRLSGLLPALKEPRFQALMRGQAQAAPLAAEGDLAQMLATMPREDGIALLTQNIAQAVAQILHLPAERLELEKSIFDLGMDSLMGLELRLSVEQKFGVTLSPMLLSQDIGIRRLAAIIHGQVTGAGDDAPAIDASDLERREIMARHAETLDARDVEDALTKVRATPHARLIS